MLAITDTARKLSQMCTERRPSKRAGAAGGRTGTGTCRCRPRARGPAQTATSRAAAAARSSSSPVTRPGRAASGGAGRPAAAARAGQSCARGALGRRSQEQRPRRGQSAGGDSTFQAYWLLFSSVDRGSTFQAHWLLFSSVDRGCCLSQQLILLLRVSKQSAQRACPRQALAARQWPPARAAPAAAASRPASRGAGCSAGRSPGHRSSRGCPVSRTRTGRRTAAAPPRQRTLCHRDNEQGFVQALNSQSI